MSKTSTCFGLATGAGLALYVTGVTVALGAAHLSDSGIEQQYQFDRTEAAVRRVHRALMKCHNYQALFPEERAKEIRDICTLILNAMVKQIDPLYQKDAVEYALNNLVHFCSEEIS